MTVSRYVSQNLPRLIRRARSAAKKIVSSEDGDREAVHAFRVSLRKLRTVLRTTRSVYGKYYTNYFRKALGDVAKSTGDLRDTEVEIEILLRAEPAGEDAAAHSVWATRLSGARAREMDLRGRLREKIGDAEFLYPLKQLEALLILPVQARNDPPGEPYALGLLQTQRERVSKMLTEIDDEQHKKDWFHGLRLEFKRLRYIADFYAYLLPPSSRDILKISRKLQNSLGDFHDFDLFLERLESEPGSEDSEPLRSHLTEFLAEGRDTALASFRRKWNKRPDLLL